jgi:putative MFS transporter
VADTPPRTEPSLTRTERLDRLPFSRQHGKLLAGSGTGWALDAMDVGLISFVIAALAQEWSLSATQVSWVVSIGFAGMAVGASVGGLLADRIGRRQVFALTLLVYGLATGATALVGSVGLLLVLRFVTGLGLGAELPVASTLVSEFAPKRMRGRVVVLLEAFWAVGWIAAATIGYLVVPLENGWRWAFAIGVIPALFAVVVRRGLPESVRFLERKGRVAEAEAAVRRFEASAGVEHVASETIPAEPAPPRWRELWRPDLRRRTAALWIAWFGINFAYYGAFLWLPSILVESGFTIVKSFEYTLYITLAQLPGYALAAYLIERWGRRPTLITFLAVSAGAAFAFGQADSIATILIAGMVLSAFNLGAWGALYAITPEIYPTSMRGSGAGAAAAFGRLASIIAPLTVPPLLAAGGPTLTFGVFAAAFGVAMVATVFLPELRNAALVEDVDGAR